MDRAHHLGVVNGPLKFLTARKILPLLDLLAKFKRASARLLELPKFCSCSHACLSVLLDILWIFLWIKVKVILYGA